jgi:hypothetical protein
MVIRAGWSSGRVYSREELFVIKAEVDTRAEFDITICLSSEGRV